MTRFEKLEPGMAVAFDYETFYSSKIKYSLKNMSPYDYVRDPRFDAYLVAFRAASGESFVGHPTDFDWSCLEGMHLVAHNATFDGMVLMRQMEQGIVPRFNYKLDCTADMSSFMNAGRSLKDAAKNLLGMELSKKMRSDMDGKTFHDLNSVEVHDLLEYGGSDADVCFELWDRFSSQWPEWEKEISRENRAACWRGVRIDVEATKAGLEILKAKNEAAMELIPWIKDGKAAGSTPQLKKHAIALGIPVPPSFNKTTPEMQAWVKKYAEEHPFIQARLDYASTNPHIARLESMIEIADENGIVRFDSRYFGSHTGRCSGSGGEGKKGATGGARMNFFNMPKGEKKDGIVHGVDIRGLIIPRPGHKFIIYDYSNVEPRITHWIAGNHEFLQLVYKENIYQVNAKMMGWFPKDGRGMKTDNPKLYQLSKACLTEETLVLTDAGYKRIVDITLNERVWDGRDWVMHEGVILNGYRSKADIVQVNGECFTRDHVLYGGPEIGTCSAEEASKTIRKRSSCMDWRQSSLPVSSWDDLRALARGIIHSLAKEWVSVYRMYMSRLRNPV